MAVASQLKSLQALELAVRTGSLRRAAEILSITPAAVGQRIKVLEDFLGIELVVRGRMGLKPTAALESALPSLRNAFRELGEASEALDLQRVNEIHIAANSDWVELWLAPRLDDFRKAYPNIRFCINGVGDVPMRLGPSDVEVTFRACADGPEIDTLFRDYLVPVGSAENTERIGRLRRADKLEGFPLLHLDFYRNDPHAIDWPRWAELHGHRQSGRGRGIRFQRLAPALQAVASDAGFLISGLALISDKIDRNAFTIPFPLAMGGWTSHAFQARFRRDAARRNQVRRFREWLGDESRKTRAWLEQTAQGQPGHIATTAVAEIR